MNKNPARRLGAGSGDAEEVKNHPYFNAIDWNAVYAKQVAPPMVPTIVFLSNAERCDGCVQL